MVAHVDHLFADSLGAPLVERLGKRRALRLDDEVDVGRRSAERSGGLAGLDVVDRGRAAERHVQVGVRVDAAREDVRPGGIDHLVGRLVERLPDQGHGLVLDVEVGDVVVGGRDDAAALDQYGHGLLLALRRV